MEEVALQKMPHRYPGRAAGKAAAARIGEWSAGSSTSSGEEDQEEKVRRQRFWSFKPNLSIIRERWRRSAGRAVPSTQERKWHGGRVGNGL